MKENTAKKFLNNETFQLVKKELDVNFLNPEVMLTVSEKAIASIAYWEGRAVKGTKEQKQIYAIEIAKLEALMQRMTDLSLDVYEVNATAYLDARGHVEDKSVENVLVDVAEKADIGTGAAAEEIPILSIFDGKEEVKTPKLTDLSAAIKSLLKKGHFDSANLLAAKYLTIGDYVPKKEKQQPVKWSEEKIASWIRDINDSLMSEKVDAKKEIKKKEDTKKEDKDIDAAANGLTGVEVENLRLLECVIPDAIAGQQDYQSRREKLQSYLALGKDLNAEDAMLWAYAKRIGGANGTTKLPEADLAKLFVDLTAFGKIFFAHRPYTEDSVKAWREAAKKETNISNFKYLKVNADVDPSSLKKSGINMEAITKRIEEECLAGKTVQEVLAGLEEGILYKVIEGKDKTSTPIYTNLHAKDLVERIYSVYATKPKVEDKSKVKVDAAVTIISADKSKVDIAEVKLLLSTIAENGGIFDDVKIHPEVLNLIDREIQVNPKSPALKFSKDAVLFPYLEKQFNEIVSKLPKAKITDTLIPEETEIETKTADLNNMTTLCDFAARNDVTQEDFIKEHQPLVMTKAGGFKSLMSETTKGGSKTISIANAKDFETWVASVYKEAKDKKPATENPELVKSMKELQAKGKELLEKGTTFEVFTAWLNKNLLNRKLLEQKPDKHFKSVDAIIAFAKNTWKEKMPKPTVANPTQPAKESQEKKPGAGQEIAETANSTKEVAEVAQNQIENKEAKEKIGESTPASSVLSADEISAQVAAISTKDGITLYSLIVMLRDLYVKNGILVEGAVCTLKTANKLVEAIVKESNPTMFTERQQRKAELEAQRKDQPELHLEGENNNETSEIGPIEAKTETIVEGETADTDIIDAEFSVFEKIDVAAMDPELWKTIEKFTTLEQAYNQAVEFNEAGNFNAALSMCLVMLPKIEASKEWTPEYITDWFNKMILKKNIETDKVDEVAETSAETKEVIELGPEFDELKAAKNPKSFKHCIADILKSKEDNKELRNQIIAAINSGNGSHTRQVAKMPDGEKHKQINNIKEKITNS